MKSLSINDHAKVGTVETTMEPTFYDITREVRNKPDDIKSVFLVDMPGMGGMMINRAKYLHEVIFCQNYKNNKIKYSVWPRAF